MYKRCIIFALALALCSTASAQQKLNLDIQLLKLGVRGSQNSFEPDDVFSAQSNSDLTVGSLPESSFKSGRANFRSRFTPRLAFDFGTKERGWTAVAWGFRQTARTGSEASSSWRMSSRLEAASIDVAYRMRIAGNFSTYAGIKTAYMRTEEANTTASVKTQNVAAAGGVGPLLGMSYSVKISRLELAASVSQSFLGMRSQSSFQGERSYRDFWETAGFASVTEASARALFKLTNRLSAGLGAFFSSWHGVTVINGQDSSPSRQNITFGGGLASVGFSF